VDLVDEKQRALSRRAALFRRVEDFFQVGDAGEDRRDLDESEIGLLRQKAGDGGLAGAGRSPENQAAERAGRDPARQRAPGPTR
jgi:hypothetical protein